MVSFHVIDTDSMEECCFSTALRRGSSALRPGVNTRHGGRVTNLRRLHPLARAGVYRGHRVATFGAADFRRVHLSNLGLSLRWPAGHRHDVELRVYMATPEVEVEAPTYNRQVGTTLRSAPGWFVPFTHALFGTTNGQFWEACVRHGKVSLHPIWEFAADCTIRDRIALLGDADHLASPRTGIGAYTAIVDAATLGAAFSNCEPIEATLNRYNNDTVARAAALLHRSRKTGNLFLPRGGPIPSPKQVLQQISPNFSMLCLEVMA